MTSNGILDSNRIDDLQQRKTNQTTVYFEELLNVYEKRKNGKRVPTNVIRQCDDIYYRVLGYFEGARRRA
jgi:hypothetical protein